MQTVISSYGKDAEQLAAWLKERIEPRTERGERPENAPRLIAFQVVDGDLNTITKRYAVIAVIEDGRNYQSRSTMAHPKGGLTNMASEQPIIGALFDELFQLIDDYEYYDLSFGIEYSDVIDFSVDITPRRGHPMARDYGATWGYSGVTLESAMRQAIDNVKQKLPLPPQEADKPIALDDDSRALGPER